MSITVPPAGCNDGHLPLPANATRPTPVSGMSLSSTWTPEFGAVLHSAAVAYGRRNLDATLPDDAQTNHVPWQRFPPALPS
jgi:hypothetical protein